MTKEELKKELSAQKALKNFFSFTGKRWVSYKAGQFAVSDDIVYIPSTISWFSANKNKHSEEEINDILRWCLTGNFLRRIRLRSTINCVTAKEQDLCLDMVLCNGILISTSI